MSTGVTESGTAAELVPDELSLDALRAAAAECTACHLYQGATQTVFGDGAADARVLFVGEQPGDQEDLEGEPFVGPAGRELDRALDAAGIARADIYITNAVKHFKWKPQGRRRLHQKPNAEEIRACAPWLDAELRAVRPDVIVALGATAAQALLGRSFRVTQQRGEPHEGPDGLTVIATVHPSSILRSRGDDERHAAREAFTDDLRAVAQVLNDTRP